MYNWQIRHVNTLADLIAYTLQIINPKETPGVQTQTVHLKRFKDALLKKAFDRTNESSCNNFFFRHEWQHLLFTDFFWEDSLNKQVWTRLFQFKECLVSFFYHVLQNFMFLLQTVQALIRCRRTRRLFKVYTVHQCPFYGTPGVLKEFTVDFQRCVTCFIAQQNVLSRHVSQTIIMYFYNIWT